MTDTLFYLWCLGLGAILVGKTIRSLTWLRLIVLGLGFLLLTLPLLVLLYFLS